MEFYRYLLLLLLPLVAAQGSPASIQPSSDPLPSQVSQLQLTYGTAGGMSAMVSVAPLTTEIGLGANQVSLSDLKIQGTLKTVDAHSETSINASNIAYISCDPNTNTSNLSPTDVVNEIINVQPKLQGILLYSLTAPHCSLTGSFKYTTILSMTSVQDSQTLKSYIDMAGTLPKATIADEDASSSGGAANGTVGNAGGQSSTNQAPAPTTAVAMSILYSITGIITLLFLIIIATGAIRAHRHPERYGPRGGIAGRPRQSRAKGLARAMLETLPIVKFGDPEPPKQENRDIELDEGGSEVHATSAVSTPPKAEHETEPGSTDTTTVVAESGMGPDTNTSEGIHTEDNSGPSELGCSICTEDFEKGEDVRVLPCNHKYHPACIDPWLLNVSGTCPLCRVDLRPAETQSSEVGGAGVGGENLPPPLAETEGAETTAHPTRGRVSRRLDAALLRNASANERIAALRQLRQNQVEGGTANRGLDAEREEQTRRRLASRLRDVFRIRTRRVGAGSISAAVPSSAPAASSTTDAPETTTTEPAQQRGIEETL